MGKNTFSFSLEEDIIQKIDKVKKDLNLSSRSAALERIVLAYGSGSGVDRDGLKALIREVMLETEGNKGKSNIPSILEATIKDAFNSMED